jgi:hypothetical protein
MFERPALRSERADSVSVVGVVDLSYPVGISTGSSIGPRVKVLSLCVKPACAEPARALLECVNALTKIAWGLALALASYTYAVSGLWFLAIVLLACVAYLHGEAVAAVARTTDGAFQPRKVLAKIKRKDPLLALGLATTIADVAPSVTAAFAMIAVVVMVALILGVGHTHTSGYASR